MNELDFLPQYVDAAKDSTNRTRHILVVMIIASILMFAAVWNSRFSGWGNTRLRLARATEDIVAYEPSKSNPDPKGWQRNIKEGDREIYNKAFDQLQDSHRNHYQVQQLLFWDQQIRAEQVGRIQVPVLGINLDVNDIGLLGGITLIVLLMWAYYSLWHHAYNLRVALDFADELGDKQRDDKGINRLLFHTYQNLAMSQVFTIPPRPECIRVPQDGQRLKGLLRKASKLLYALPLAVQAIVVWHDWATRHLGYGVSVRGTYIVLATGWGCLLAILFLTVMCFSLWRKINKKWQTVADSLKKPDDRSS